jgi:hypothetical protein
MPDLLLALVLVALVLLAAFLLVVGGAMTMTGMSTTAGLVFRPLAAGALVGLVAMVLLLGGAT